MKGTLGFTTGDALVLTLCFRGNLLYTCASEAKKDSIKMLANPFSDFQKSLGTQTLNNQ